MYRRILSAKAGIISYPLNICSWSRCSFSYTASITSLSNASSKLLWPRENDPSYCDSLSLFCKKRRLLLLRLRHLHVKPHGFRLLLFSISSPSTEISSSNSSFTTDACAPLSNIWNNIFTLSAARSRSEIFILMLIKRGVKQMSFGVGFLCRRCFRRECVIGTHALRWQILFSSATKSSFNVILPKPAVTITHKIPAKRVGGDELYGWKIHELLCKWSWPSSDW